MQSLIDALTSQPDPTKRSAEMKSLIAETLENIPFFNEFVKGERIKSNARHLLQEFSSYLNLESFNAGDNICREGEKGEKFYIILSGSVSIYQSTGQASSPLTGEAYFFATNIKIGHLKEGGTFGELALSLNKPRFATVKANVPVLVCSLHKESYNKMTNYLQHQLEIKTSALAQLFPNWAPTSLVRLAYSMQIEVYPKNHFIYKQGMKSNGFYIVSEGEVRLEQFRSDQRHLCAPVAILMPGSLFGVQDTLAKQAYKHNAQCLSQKVTVYRFPGECLDQLGTEFCQKTLAQSKSLREPKVHQICLKGPTTKSISLRAILEKESEEDSSKRSNVLKSKAYSRSKLRTLHHKSKTEQNFVTFRNPFFSDLDPENFKQIKKIEIEKEKLMDPKKYNERFQVQNYFEPINWGTLLKPLKTQQTEQGTGATTLRNTVVSYPTSGYSLHRAKASGGNSLHTRQSTIKKK